MKDYRELYRKVENFQEMGRKIKDYQNLIGAVIIALAIIIAGASISKSIDSGASLIGSSTQDIGTNINIVVTELNKLLKNLVND